MLGEDDAVRTTLNDVTKKQPEQQVVAEFARLAQERGLLLAGPDRLLKQLTTGKRCRG